MPRLLLHHAAPPVLGAIPRPRSSCLAHASHPPVVVYFPPTSPLSSIPPDARSTPGPSASLHTRCSSNVESRPYSYFLPDAHLLLVTTPLPSPRHRIND
ncbi:hypothetical protein FB451DRAFT_1311355 [Mycena latifolia]|nr:hypothetical protein FB451DRAFT_1311355 [Mycena latifolia]